MADVSIDLALEKSLQSAQDLLERAQQHSRNSLNQSIQDVSNSMDKASALQNDEISLDLAGNMLLEDEDKTPTRKKKKDDIFNATLERFRTQLKSIETSPERDRTQSRDSPAFDVPTRQGLHDDLPNQRVPDAKEASMLLPGLESAKNHKSVSIATSPLYKSGLPVRDHETMQPRTRSPEQVVGEQIESIETLQMRLHELSQKFVKKQRDLVEEQSDAVHHQAMKQIQYLQELQNQQVNYQINYVKRMREAVEEGTKISKTDLFLSTDEFKENSDVPVKEGTARSTEIKRKRNSDKNSRNIEKKVAELLEEKLAAIQGDFRECLEEIKVLKQELITPKISYYSQPQHADNDLNKVSGKSNVAISKFEADELKASLGWSPLDDLMVKSQVSKKSEDKSPPSPLRSQPAKRSRLIVGEPLDYIRLNRLGSDLHKKWNQVLNADGRGKSDLSKVTVPKVSQEDPAGSGQYSDLLDPDRIQSVIEKRMEQAAFEKLYETYQAAEHISHFKPPQSEAHVHVSQLHKGQHPALKQNKAITRTIVGKEQITEEKMAPRWRPVSPEIVAVEVKTAKPKTPILKRPVAIKPNANRGGASSPVSKAKRPESPLRPPNFYNVRLSNAPIFLRRTTVRPPNLNFLDRRSPSPRRSPSSPNRSRSHSPIKQEFFVERRTTSDAYLEHQNPLVQQPFTHEREEAADATYDHQGLRIDGVRPSRTIAFDEYVQTGPVQKTHGTQMTPHESIENSEHSEVLLKDIKTKVTTKILESIPRVEHQKSVEREIGTQYLSPAKDVSAQYSLTEESSEIILNFNKSIQPTKPRPKDEFVEPTENDLYGTLGNSELESKVAEWIQNEVLLRILTQRGSELPATASEPVPVPKSIENVLKQESIKQPIAPLVVKSDASIQVDPPVETILPPPPLPVIEKPTVIPEEPSAPEPTARPTGDFDEAAREKTDEAIKDVVYQESRAIAKALHAQMFEARLWDKLNEEASKRGKFLEHLEAQRLLDQAERDRLQKEAALERERLLEEIKQMQRDAHDRSIEISEDKANAFLLWQQKLEINQTQQQVPSSPIKEVVHKEVQSDADHPIEPKSIQTDTPVPQETLPLLPLETIPISTSLPIPPSSVASKEIVQDKQLQSTQTLQQVTEKKQTPVSVAKEASTTAPAQRQTFLIHVGGEVTYDESSVALKEDKKESSSGSKSKTDSSLATSVGTSILSTMLSEGEIVTHLYSEGEVIGMIHRRALDAMIDKGDSSYSIKPPVTTEKGKSKAKDDNTSLGEASDVADSPGELSQIGESISRAKKILEVAQVERMSASVAHTGNDSGSGDHQSQVSSIHPEPVQAQKIHLHDELPDNVAHPVAGAWHDSSNVSGSAIPSITAPKTPRNDGGEDEVQSILGSLSSVSQRTAESMSTPSFSVSEEPSPRRSPLAKKGLWGAEDDEDDPSLI